MEKLCAAAAFEGLRDMSFQTELETCSIPWSV